MTHPVRSILVTGAAGFVGSNFVHYWRTHYPTTPLVALDALTYAGNVSSIRRWLNSDNFVFCHGDIRDTTLVERLMRTHGTDTIVNFAAESHVDRSISDDDAFIHTNIVGTHSLLKAAKAVWLDTSETPHRFHQASTDEVYGSLGPGEHAFRESAPFSPNSPYAASKASADHLVQAYHATFGLDTVTSHCSNNYGPYQFPEKLIPLVIVNALHGRPLPVYGDGLNVRDWLHVMDHVQGIDQCLRRGMPGERYNFGGHAERTNLEVIDMVCSELDERFARDASLAAQFPMAPTARGQPSRSLIRFVADRPGHDRRYAIDTAKVEADLGYTAPTSFEHGLATTVTWYLHNSDWWKALTTASPAHDAHSAPPNPSSYP